MMDIKEARKLVENKPKDNYMLLRMEYDKYLVLPMKDAIPFVNALTNAEQYKERYNEPSRIDPLDRSLLKFEMLSHQEYVNLKIATLLGMDVKDLTTTE